MDWPSQPVAGSHESNRSPAPVETQTILSVGDATLYFEFIAAVQRGVWYGPRAFQIAGGGGGGCSSGTKHEAGCGEKLQVAHEDRMQLNSYRGPEKLCCSVPEAWHKSLPCRELQRCVFQQIAQKGYSSAHRPVQRWPDHHHKKLRAFAGERPPTLLWPTSPSIPQPHGCVQVATANFLEARTK